MDAVKKMTMIALAVGAIATQGSAFAADGTINFTGSVIDSGCTVAETAGGPLTIAMGTFAKTAFANVGDRSAEKNFTLTLTNCPTTSPSGAATPTVRIRFSGVLDANNNKLLALDSTSTAKGLALGLIDTVGNDLLPQNDSTAVSIVGGNATLNLRAFYQRTGAITAGSTNATAYFTLTYP